MRNMGSTASTTLAEESSGALLGAANASPVLLNVYDLNEDWLRANNLFGDVLKIGGAFHAGVEIHGREWSFGQNGITYILPRSHEVHVFRQSIVMGVTSWSLHQVASLIERDFTNLWTGPQYDIFRRNCCSFADALCLALTGRGIPPWVDRFPKIASVASSNLNFIAGIRGSVDASVAASGAKSGLGCSYSAPNLDTAETRKEPNIAETRQTPISTPPVVKKREATTEVALAKEDKPAKQPPQKKTDVRVALSAAAAEIRKASSDGTRRSSSTTCKRPSRYMMNPGAEMCRRPATRFKV